jgi:hypothetical protein
MKAGSALHAGKASILQVRKLETQYCGATLSACSILSPWRTAASQSAFTIGYNVCQLRQGAHLLYGGGQGLREVSARQEDEDIAEDPILARSEPKDLAEKDIGEQREKTATIPLKNSVGTEFREHFRTSRDDCPDDVCRAGGFGRASRRLYQRRAWRAMQRAALRIPQCPRNST